MWLGRICETPSHKLIVNEEKQIYETLSHKLQNIENEDNDENIPAEKLLSSISFSHFIELMKIDNPVKRLYYEMLTIQTGPSVRELKRQIDALSYERIGLSGDMEHAERSQKKINKDTSHVQSELENEHTFLHHLWI